MSFGKAFRFPFNNWPKVLTIALVFTIAIAVIVIASVNIDRLDSVLFMTLALVAVQALFLSGYGVRVVRHLLNGHDTLPPIELVGDIGNGVMVLLGSLFHLLPLLGIGIVGGILSVFIGEFALLATFLISVPVTFVLGWAIVIGLARYASNEYSSCMFEVQTNVDITKQHSGRMFAFTAWNLLLGIIYSVLTNVVSVVYDNTVAFNLWVGNWQTTAVVVLVVGYVLTITLSILQQLSSLHLIAQLAPQVGIEGAKAKRKNDGSFAYEA